MALEAYLQGIGLLGPGLAGWPGSELILAGTQMYQPARTVLPSPTMLPAAERRRSGAIVKLSLATGMEAITAARLGAATLPTVFSSSGGDGENCHAICDMLSRGDFQISPTRFHSSVHNIAAGYWGIAAGCMATASVLGAHDGSFGAGLLEAVVQTMVDNTPVVLLAYDVPYPDPIGKVRHIPDAFGVALVLAPSQDDRSMAHIRIDLTEAPADRLDNPELEHLRSSIPAARSLPLLCRLAQHGKANVILDYLDDMRLAVATTPC